MHKPWHSLLYVVAFFLALGALSLFFPKEGLSLGNGFVLRFPSLFSLFEKKESKTDISQILKAADDAEKDETQASENKVKQMPELRKNVSGSPQVSNQSAVKSLHRAKAPLITGIQYRSISALSNFFEALKGLATNAASSVRVLHYGDSQIEGDRITDLLRLKMQAKFGGAGPGLISLMPVSSSVINKIAVSKTWDRYNCGTSKDKRVKHRDFGPMAGFTRFNVYKKIYDTSKVITATVNITTTPSGGKNVMQYKKLKLFYGGGARKTWCEFYDGPALMAADSLLSSGVMNVKEYKVGQGSFTHAFKFRSKDSPDFYAASLEGEGGLMIDNIALRGSSGTFFHLINPDQLRQFYQYLNVKLVILQFGGNALPAMLNDTMVKNYASWIKGQINILRKIKPGINILFIGPADMSVKNGTEYITHPYLEMMRDELKRVLFETNCAFFDMYDCMGGRNSMVSWVDAKLAASDYIHFSPNGARKVSVLLHAALMNEYEKYLNQ